MSSSQPLRFRLAIAGVLVAAGPFAAAGSLVPPAAAQEGEAAPAQDAPADEAPAAKRKPKPKPRAAAPKPKPPETKVPETKPGDTKPADAENSPAAEAPVLEPAGAPGKAVWPNGARTVSESYGDWTMNCNREGPRTDCVVIQSQGDRKTGRRQFSVELRAPKDGRAEGLILMPFGLQIEPGVSFKLDDRALGKGAPYSWCVADGCLVPISLPTLATDAMKTAQAMSVSAMKPDAKEPTVIAVPLSGFAAAFARAGAFGS